MKPNKLDVRISVIIPVYNMADSIADALDSFFSQEYKNKELIVLDGGSTDGSLEIIKKYRDKIDFFITERDEGPSAAIAKNLYRTTGDVIGVLGADDSYVPNALAEVGLTFRDEKVDVAYGDCYTIFHDGKKISKKASLKKLDDLYYYCSIFSNATFLRKDLLTKYYKECWRKHKEEISICTDHYLWLWLYHNKRTFRHIDSKKPIVNFSMSGRSNKAEYKACLEDELVLNYVLENNDQLKEKHKTQFEKFFAARTVLEYEKVIGRKKFIEELQKYFSKEEKYVIWGFGRMGFKAFYMLKCLGMEPIFFLDNNQNNQQSIFSGIRVYDPSVLYDKSDVTVIITPLGAETEISKQIDELSNEHSIKTINYSNVCEMIMKSFGRDILPH